MKLSPRNPIAKYDPDSWWREVEHEGRRYRVSVERGRRVLIAFKPRGENYGFHWYGTVYDENRRVIWRGRVNKSTGARGLLLAAQVITG